MIDRDAITYLSDIPGAHARTRGDDIAIVHDGRTTSYAELEARSNAVAAMLRSLGLEPGRRVAWLGRNCDRWYDLFFGCAKSGLCLAPINFRLAPPEIAFILEDSEAPVVFATSEFVAMLAKATAGLATPPRIVDVDSLGALPADAPVVTATPQPEDDVLQLYTSGTTGLPKGVQLTHGNYAAFLAISSEVEGFSYDAADTVLIVMPLFHVAGTNVSFTGLANGSRIVVVSDFVPKDVLRLIEAERVAHMFLVPAMIQMLLHAPEMAGADLSSLKTIAYGASPISEAVLAAAKARFGCDFVQFYGMTESTGGATYLSPAAHTPDKLRSCGRAWPSLEVKIGDAQGNELPVGEVGEIMIRGGVVMKGYWKREAATAETLTDGWLRTGDAGYACGEGYFYVHDRVKDMIVSGGENIYPAEVENAIFGCPGVADVAVIGVPDDKWGEAVKAVVVPAAGAAPRSDDIIAWARGRIAGYKVPKSIEFAQALPRNSSGKVLRRELRAKYWAGRGRAVG